MVVLDWSPFFTQNILLGHRMCWSDVKFQVAAAGVFQKAQISLEFSDIWSYDNYSMFHFIWFSLPAWQLRQQSPWWRYCSFSTHVLCCLTVRFLYSSLDHWDAGSSAAWHTSPMRNAATNIWIFRVGGKEQKRKKTLHYFCISTAYRLIHSNSLDEGQWRGYSIFIGNLVWAICDLIWTIWSEHLPWESN